MSFDFVKFFKKHLLSVIFLACFSAFLITKYSLRIEGFAVTFLSFATFVSIALILLFELLSNGDKGKKTSLQKTLLELATAFGSAFLVYLIAGFLLGTSTPINVITSCSMLPNYDRGDLIILRGGEIKAPEIRVSSNDGISFERGNCQRIYFNGTVNGQTCTIGLKVRDELVLQNSSNDLIVFEPSDKRFGLIIHRVLAKLNVDGKLVYVTKGDNNNVADREFGISFAMQEDVKGKVLLRIPFLGYVKLFLFLQFEEPPFCNSFLTVKP